MLIEKTWYWEGLFLNLMWAVEISSIFSKNHCKKLKMLQKLLKTGDNDTTEIQSLHVHSRMIIFSIDCNLSVHASWFVASVMYQWFFILDRFLKFFHLSELQSCLRMTKVLLSFVTNQKKRPKKGQKWGPKWAQKWPRNPGKSYNMSYLIFIKQWSTASLSK